MVKEVTDRVRPNISTIKDLMKRTYNSRAEAMSTMNTAEVLEKFPYLAIPTLVCINFWSYDNDEHTGGFSITLLGV